MTEDETEALVRRRTQWVEAVNSGSVPDHEAVLGKSVLWLRPGQLALKGRSKVLEWLTPFFEQFDYDFSVEGAAVRVTGEWAVERATYISKLRPKDAERWEEHTGVYLMTWHKRPGDNWFVHQYVDVTGLLVADSPGLEDHAGSR